MVSRPIRKPLGSVAAAVVASVGLALATPTFGLAGSMGAPPGGAPPPSPSGPPGTCSPQSQPPCPPPGGQLPPQPPPPTPFPPYLSKVCTGPNPDGTVSGTELDTCTIYANTSAPIRTNDWLIVSPAAPPPGAGIVVSNQAAPTPNFPVVTSCAGMTAVGSAIYQVFASLEAPGESPAVSPPINGNACVFTVAGGAVPNGKPLGTESFQLPVTAPGTAIQQTALFCPPASSGFRTCFPPASIPVRGPGAVVVDEIPPTIGNLPTPVTVQATSASGAAVTYAMPSVSDDAPGASLACSPASGSVFPIHTSTVTCVATDAAGLTSTATFTVTVQVTFAGVRALVQQWATEPGAAHSLMVKLDNAAGAWSQGNTAATAGMMKAFVNEVEAQSGKALSLAAGGALAGLGAILETGPVIS